MPSRGLDLPRPPIPSYSRDSFSRESFSRESFSRDTFSPPPRQRPVEGECKKRLFIVSQPERISSSLLTDMFSKFGEFLNFSYIPGE